MSPAATAVGHPTTTFEWYGTLPQSYMAHLMSMVTEGVFERFPTLKIVLYEGGVFWLPHVMWRFDKKTLDDAVNIIPGVTASNTGGSRNERLIYVRGFDRFQVPLSIDGIRIYLPADNRLDFGRFLTPDLSEIQVSKGYVSVLDGPGGMGGFGLESVWTFSGCGK